MRKVMYVLAALALGACATLGMASFKEPGVTLRNVVINGLGMSGGAMDVELGIYNPNGFKLDATRVTYKLLVGNDTLGTGQTDQRLTVQKNDSAVVRLPIDFTYAGLSSAARQVLTQGTVNYRVLGDVTVATPLGNFTRPYDQTGRFSTVRGGR